MSPQPSAGVHDAPSDGLSSIRMAALVPWASYTHAQAPAGCPGGQDQIDRLGNRLAADSQLSKQLGPDLIKAQQAHLVADSAYFGRTGSLTSFSTDVLSLATDYGGDTAMSPNWIGYKWGEQQLVSTALPPRFHGCARQ